ncbi:DUF6671 family protein [Gudongella sp. DL1XJH-153]|uniref:DUF6671 family protein n=1 Tax=Gudongella sp. DL1XJH-153 TaxID=3409804 RepID=UPI003BB74F1D
MTANEIVASIFNGREGLLATMHRKEEAMAPILEEELKIDIIIPSGFNSDKFGTFTGEISRMGDQLESARYKANAAMDLYNKTLVFSSEGSFGSHPSIPFVPINREIVLLIDRDNNLEISGASTTTDTNYGHMVASSFQEAYDFAISSGFPEHGMVVKAERSFRRSPLIIKGITSKDELKKAADLAIRKSRKGKFTIEPDMRALYNPTRMKNIEAATRDLVKNIRNLCPECSFPGFQVTKMKEGLPCDWCGLPTDSILSHQYSCNKCGYTEDKLYPDGVEKADSANCHRCNP